MGGFWHLVCPNHSRELSSISNFFLTISPAEWTPPPHGATSPENATADDLSSNQASLTLHIYHALRAYLEQLYSDKEELRVNRRQSRGCCAARSSTRRPASCPRTSTRSTPPRRRPARGSPGRSAVGRAAGRASTNYHKLSIDAM